MASSKLNPDEPIEFENGREAHIIATLSSSGKCKWTTGEYSHAETYATLYERGVRFMVATDRWAKVGGTVGERGQIVPPWEEGFFTPHYAVRNRVFTNDPGAMADLEAWGMFA